MPQLWALLSWRLNVASGHQAISIYRRLGVSSRGQAIQRMQQTGLIGA